MIGEDEFRADAFFNWGDNPYCAGCLYYRPIDSRNGKGKVCHYLLDIGQSRGCPFGENCTQKKTRQTSR